RSGLLQELFVVEATTMVGTCRNCGAREPVGAARVFRGAGIVLRCPHCDHALGRLVKAQGRMWVDLGGIRSLDFVRPLRVDPGSPPNLDRRDPGSRLGLPGKEEGLDRLRELVERLALLHNRLFAERSRALLLVLQGMDASGKDGTIRHVLTGVNPQGCRVVSFREPAGLDLAHDYLWRV